VILVFAARLFRQRGYSATSRTKTIHITNRAKEQSGYCRFGFNSRSTHSDSQAMILKR